MRDRLFGELHLPSIARELAESCPMLLRLREVRLPNVPLLTFPSYAGTSRYEHSLGVAHLAWWWSRRVGLDRLDGEALAVAALYHDAATPAFSHLFEEHLASNGFDHEAELAHSIATRGSIAGGAYAQVFLGRAARLRPTLLERGSAGTRLSVEGLHALMTSEDPLGVVIHGDFDLDNIDNTVRAATAMGLDGSNLLDPYKMAAALAWDGSRVSLGIASAQSIGDWRKARRAVYENLLSSKKEFLAQTAVKWAIELCGRDPDHESLYAASAWALTEPELIYGHLRQVPQSRALIDDLRLGLLPKLICCLGHDDLTSLMHGGIRAVSEMCALVSSRIGYDCYANFYVDKRERQIRLPVEDALWRLEDLVVGPASGAAVLLSGQIGFVVGRTCRMTTGDSVEFIYEAVDEAVSKVLGSPGRDYSTDWRLSAPVYRMALQESLL